MRTSRRLPIALLVTLPGLLLGCPEKKPDEAAPDASAAVSPSASASAVTSAAPSATAPASTGSSTFVQYFRAGPAALYLDVTERTTISDETRATVEKLADQLDLDEDDAPLNEMKSLHDDAVVGIRAGELDTKKFDARVAALVKTTQARLDKEAVAMNALWAALTPEERKAVVAEVTDRANAKPGDRARGGDAGVVAAVDAGLEAPAVRAKRRLEKLKRELDLDDAQLPKVQAALEKLPPETDGRAEASRRTDDLAKAFTGATFDAKKLEAFGPAAAKARVPMDTELAFLAPVVPLLKPEQRLVLAGRLEGERLRVGTGRPPPRTKDWPFPFELETADTTAAMLSSKPIDKSQRGKPRLPPGTRAPQNRDR
jgi:Spy/CpxP family protein refolding chaperone